jgi:hypothetical protein
MKVDLCTATGRTYIHRAEEMTESTRNMLPFINIQGLRQSTELNVFFSDILTTING